jgi:hypothetical protein
MYGFPPLKSLKKTDSKTSKDSKTVSKQKSFIDKSKSYINIREILQSKKHTVVKINPDTSDLEIVNDI